VESWNQRRGAAGRYMWAAQVPVDGCASEADFAVCDRLNGGRPVVVVYVDGEHHTDSGMYGKSLEEQQGIDAKGNAACLAAGLIVLRLHAAGVKKWAKDFRRATPGETDRLPGNGVVLMGSGFSDAAIKHAVDLCHEVVVKAGACKVARTPNCMHFRLEGR
jgi:hypothetical protein